METILFGIIIGLPVSGQQIADMLAGPTIEAFHYDQLSDARNSNGTWRLYVRLEMRNNTQSRLPFDVHCRFTGGELSSYVVPCRMFPKEVRWMYLQVDMTPLQRKAVLAETSQPELKINPNLNLMWSDLQ